MSTDRAVGAVPSGFWLALPSGWVSFDVNPSTSAASARRRVALAAENDETVAANRDALERILVGAAREAAEAGVVYCAAYYESFGDFAVQANLAVSFHAAAEGTDLGRMVLELGDDEDSRTISVVELEAGRAVTRSGRRHTKFPGTEHPMELLTHQYFLPVPGTADRLAVVAFASPTLPLEHDLIAVFDTIASSFAFTDDDSAR